MAEKKTSELAAATTVADADEVEIVQGGVSKRASLKLQRKLAAQTIQLADIAALRARTLVAADAPATVTLAKNYVANDGGGTFDLDTADTTTADDAGLTIVDSASGTANRWKRKPTTFVTPSDFGPMSGGSSSNAARLAAIQAAFSSGKPVQLKPGTWVVTAASSGNSALTVPAGARIEGPAAAIIQGSAATGNLLVVTGGDVRLRGFKLDGVHTANGYATGFTANHRGVYIPGTSGGILSDIHADDLHIVNFGESGYETRFCNRDRIERVRVERCGMFGVLLYSPLDCLLDALWISDIYPGNTGTDPYRNAYGIALTNSSSERVATNALIRACRVTDVPSWEGIDVHNGIDIEITDCRVTRCSQSIAYENHVAGVVGRRIKIVDNLVGGWSGASITRDSQTYYKQGGIIANGAATNELGFTLDIRGNTVYEMGDSRTSGSNSGAIYARNWRGASINENRISDAYRCGVRLDHDGTTNGGMFYVNVNDNHIDGVLTADSVTRGISASTRVLGIANDNFINGMQTGSAHEHQDSSPTYTLTFTNNRTN